MTKVLILTAAYGEGHNAAARGLQSALAERPEVEVQLLDPYADAYGSVYDRSRRDYLAVIDKFPRLWSAVYWLLHRTPIIHPAAWVQHAVRKRVRRAVEEWQPQAIVSVYPVFPYILNRLYPPARPRPFNFYTVVTDSITINSAWHRSPSDLYFVPNEESGEALREGGVPSDRVHVSGFPVPLRFARDRPERPAPETAGARVLYMINAGKQTAPDLVRRLQRIDGIQLSVTVGKDEDLRAKVEAAVRESGRPAELHGWTPHMPELLMTHHLLIGKAGGAAVQEAIAARTPVLITKVVPGQEEGNARLLELHGCGAVRETPEAIAQEIESLFANNSARWHEWESNIARLSRPNAASDMADVILTGATKGSTNFANDMK